MKSTKPNYKTHWYTGTIDRQILGRTSWEPKLMLGHRKPQWSRSGPKAANAKITQWVRTSKRSTRQGHTCDELLKLFVSQWPHELRYRSVSWAGFPLATLDSFTYPTYGLAHPCGKYLPSCFTCLMRTSERFLRSKVRKHLVGYSISCKG